MKLIFSLFLSLLISSANAGLSEAFDALKTGDFSQALRSLIKRTNQ